MTDSGHRMNGLNSQHINAATKGAATTTPTTLTPTPTFQHIICNNETYETHLTHRQHANREDEVDPDDDDIDNMAKTALASNKTYKKFVLPLDIPTPPLPLSYNTTKRLLSSHNHHHTQTASTTCQCDKQTNFSLQPHNNCSISTNSNNNNNSNNSNIKNQVNHISFIQTTPNQTPPSKKENLKLLHNKGSSSSSTLSGSIGCGGIAGALNFNVSDQHLPHHEPLQHHHLCQQKNLKLQHATHQHHHHHHHEQQQQQLQQHHSQPHCQQKVQHEQLPLYDAYASQQYLPQLPQLLSINSSNQQNSLTLSHRRMAPTFNRIADKNYMKNLVYSPAKLRRVRIILCVVGGIVLLALLGTAIYFIVSGSEDGTNNDGNGNGNGGPSNGINLEDVLQGKLVARHFNGSWSGSNIIYKENNNFQNFQAIMEYNVLTKKSTRLLLDTLQQYILYEKSADGTYLLLAKNYKKNFRHSFLAEYDIYDIATGQVKPLEIQKQTKPLIMVQWAPVGNALIINYERNLYYKPTAFADEIALTDDTNEAILNGIPDWVYEEEVFSSNSAVWFSPDGKKLAFIQFDDSPTHVINFPIYGEAADLRFQYPYNRLVAYPKAGSPNPRVKLFTSDLDRAAAGNTDHLTEIPVPSALNTEGDYIITVVDWLNNTNVLSVWMNRIQNQAHVQIFNGLRRQNTYSLISKTGWVDFFATPFKNRDGTRIAFIMPQPQDFSGEYRHLCVLSTASSTGKPEPLTKGKYVVTSILHWDPTNDIIFYTANLPNKPEQLHVYAIKAATGQTAKCLTCNLHKSNGVEQTYYSADFNTKHEVIITSLGPSIPQTVIYEWSYVNNQVNLNKIVTWEDNENLRKTLSNYDLPTMDIHSIPIADGFTAKVLLQLPPNMDRSGKTKYPMLVDVYGGPDSYSVIDRWIVDWGTYLTSKQSVIYAKIDGRGSGLRGEKLLHSVYLKLGTVEIADQIEVTRQLQEKFNFIDANHTGIWGWSYGGYAAAMALANDEKHVFRCAASIAPVTDWTYYDSIYTERYMGLPTVNELGYAASRLSTKATQLKGKKFLLVHGTLDDNVHYQQAMILAKNLERHDILFKQISYPDEDHALAGVRPHLYHSLDRFFGDCFAQPRMAHSK
ncbi:venom dipeptidyl peptidase 4 isoform X2 [Lucilia cuprina]|uniref:venom dipeptidyl peptidase 4 isoform X2 n=1 Tax=Lucilia cuprina TaxID=7375 RepID=UPI001F06BB09|nr:venom dipeptidyl peptidase 4 isoform X2 [Lucilia cuprina]